MGRAHAAEGEWAANEDAEGVRDDRAVVGAEQERAVEDPILRAADEIAGKRAHGADGEGDNRGGAADADADADDADNLWLPAADKRVKEISQTILTIVVCL